MFDLFINIIPFYIRRVDPEPWKGQRACHRIIVGFNSSSGAARRQDFYCNQALADSDLLISASPAKYLVYPQDGKEGHPRQRPLQLMTQVYSLYMWSSFHFFVHQVSCSSLICVLFVLPPFSGQLLKRFTKPKDWVLDLCSGTGTLVHASAMLGRNVVSADLDERMVSCVMPICLRLQPRAGPGLLCCVVHIILDIRS